tara:strand:- start:1366 stop:2739 length:1374 start_codon:yes stop_codon:yes gene_type:complete
MKVNIHSKKGLKLTMSIIVDKKTIQNKLDKKLIELQSQVNLKGFRPGKVPPLVIKKQFGKAIYGEVVDNILKESSSKAISDNKIRIAGTPKIDLKTFGEGKDLNYELQIDTLPEIKLKPFENYKMQNFKVSSEEKTINEKIKEIADQHKSFENRNESEVAQIGDQIIFDYSATVENKKFEGSEGKDVKIELGKDLFLKGFDEQLLKTKKDSLKKIKVNLPANHPKKELANKPSEFECKIKNIKKQVKTIVDEKFAKQMGASNLVEFKKMVKNQIESQYTQALNAITKKQILDQIEKFHELELPQNLIDNEIKVMTQHLSKEDLEKNKKNNEKIAKTRIKLGLILNEYGEKNRIQISETDVKDEIQKQIKNMPGQEKMVIDYYQKNPSAAQSLKGVIYEEKIIDLFKTKIKSSTKTISIKEAEEIISKSNKAQADQSKSQKLPSKAKDKTKTKKISKK